MNGYFLLGPCYEFNCTVSSEVCLVIADTAKCECPECSGLEEDSVCAAVGTSKDTYKNPCEARREACNQTEPMEILNVGECGGEAGSNIDWLMDWAVLELHYLSLLKFIYFSKMNSIITL